jgi:CrcB protein
MNDTLLSEQGKILLAIAGGGALGALARYGTVLLMAAWLGINFPYGTLAVNVIGSFIIGLLYVMFSEHGWLSLPMRALLQIGFLGAYTTFSSFSLETLVLLERGAMGGALLNILANLLLCLLATGLGMLVAR